MLTGEPLSDGQPRDGNFGVLIHEGLAFASDPDAGTIQTFDLDAMSVGSRLRRVMVSSGSCRDPDAKAFAAA